MQWSRSKTRVVLSVIFALVFMAVCLITAVIVINFFPDTFLTRDLRSKEVILPPLIVAPVFGFAMLFVWLNLDLHTDFSSAAILYRLTITFAPPILFYSSIFYLLLGRLRWFRKVDESPLPGPPPPPDFSGAGDAPVDERY